jgi:hypothetical protein
MPVNLNRLIWNAKEQFAVDTHKQTSLNPEYVIKKTQDLIKSGIRVY